MFGTSLKLVVVTLLVTLAIAACGSAGAQEQNPDLDRFADRIEQFDRIDAAQAGHWHFPGFRRHKPVVFVGSSTFARWALLETIFKRYHAINRGFGGSTIAEITHFAERIICRHRPQAVVFYAGTNDIGEFHHSGRRVFEDFVEFVHTVRARQPDVDIFFVSMSVPPARLQYAEEYEIGNRLIAEFAAHEPHLHFIDVTSVMHDAGGRLKEELFDPGDHLHMTESGYQAWVPILQPALESTRHHHVH